MKKWKIAKINTGREIWVWTNYSFILTQLRIKESFEFQNYEENGFFGGDPIFWRVNEGQRQHDGINMGWKRGR